MSKVYFVFILGLFSAIVPWLGFPLSVKKYLSLGAGILIAGTIVYIRHGIRSLERQLKSGKETRRETFVESHTSGPVQSE